MKSKVRKIKSGAKLAASNQTAPKGSAPLKNVVRGITDDTKMVRRVLRNLRAKKEGFTFHQLGSRWYFSPAQAEAARKAIRAHIG